MSATPTVHIVDDDASLAAALARMLRASNFKVATYCSAEHFLSKAALEEPGCLVLDLQMPGTTGLELQRRIKGMDHPLPIIFLTGQGDIPTSVRAMREGAEDFLTKLAPRADLLEAISRALKRDAKERPKRAKILEARNRLASLSPREREVLGFVVQGRMNKQIADALGIHERTVKLHRTSITTKLRAPSVAELTTLVREAEGV